MTKRIVNTLLLVTAVGVTMSACVNQGHSGPARGEGHQSAVASKTGLGAGSGPNPCDVPTHFNVALDGTAISSDPTLQKARTVTGGSDSNVDVQIADSTWSASSLDLSASLRGKKLAAASSTDGSDTGDRQSKASAADRAQTTFAWTGRDGSSLRAGSYELFVTLSLKEQPAVAGCPTTAQVSRAVLIDVP